MLASETHLERRLRGGIPIHITTGGIEILLLEAVEEPDARTGRDQRSFYVMVKTMSHLSYETKDTKEAQVVDIEALQPGCDTVVSVGAAAVRNRLILRTDGREVSLDFEFVEEP